MVLTMAMPWGCTRRTVLTAAGAAGLVAVAGCESDDGASAIPPDEAANLRRVAGESLDLATRYDAAIGQNPEQSARLTAIRDAHREHAAAIGRSLGSTVAAQAGPAPSGSQAAGGGLKALAAAEKAAAERAVAACLDAASYHAPLLGTVAAARASHAEVLQ
jgi:hypothetical protein